MTDTRSRELMTTAEVAALLRVSISTLQNQRSRGEGLPYVKLAGRQIRYFRVQVQAALEENTVRPAAG